jgi:hypothetical protein
MAHARRRILATRPKLEISDAVWAFLNDLPIPDGDSETHLEVLLLEAGDGEALREVWDRARGEVLGGWVKDHPGTRPSAWWRCEAPRQPMGNFQGCYYDARLPEQRKFISGSGCPAWMVMAYVPSYELGLPVQWAGFDASDRPVFESQAAFLQRHNLLTPHELRVLTAADYEQTEVLPEGREVLEGPCSGPNAEGVRWLNEWEAAIRARIPEARKAMGFFDYQQARPN